MVYSYYPLMIGFGFLGLGFGLLLFMSMGILWSFFFSFVYVVFVFFLWFKDVVLEDLSGQYSLPDYHIFSQGFFLFLFSELFLFFTLFWTFLDSSLCPLLWLGGCWHPEGIISPSYLGINSVASIFLMINSHIMKYSRRFLFLGMTGCENLLMICIFIGGGFLCFQYYEYNNNPFSLGDSVFSDIFYVSTGLHGLHVFIGVFFLFFNYYRLKLFNFNWYNCQSYDMCIYYWSFLEWMWAFMFCFFYIWGF